MTFRSIEKLIVVNVMATTASDYEFQANSTPVIRNYCCKMTAEEYSKDQRKFSIESVVVVILASIITMKSNVTVGFISSRHCQIFRKTVIDSFETRNFINSEKGIKNFDQNILVW